MKWLRRLLLAAFVPASLALAVLAVPQPLFAHRMEHGQWQVWSDRPIDPAMAGVLDDAARRLSRSELYDPGERFRIFICNEPWRLALYSQRFGSGMGGLADGWLTRNIYLREADIPRNRIVPPEGELADADVRPLSYFVAHEATHILESRAFGRLMAVRSPTWLTEGYADYVGKGGDFDYEENRRRLAAGDRALDPLKSGLYRRHHLLVAYAIERQGRSVRDLFADPPREEDLLRALR